MKSCVVSLAASSSSEIDVARLEPPALRRLHVDVVVVAAAAAVDDPGLGAFRRPFDDRSGKAACHVPPPAQQPAVELGRRWRRGSGRSRGPSPSAPGVRALRRGCRCRSSRPASRTGRRTSPAGSRAAPAGTWPRARGSQLDPGRVSVVLTWRVLRRSLTAQHRARRASSPECVVGLHRGSIAAPLSRTTRPWTGWPIRRFRAAARRERRQSDFVHLAEIGFLDRSRTTTFADPA